MAFIDATKLNALNIVATASLSAKVQKNETREGDYGATEAVILSTPEFVSGGQSTITRIKSSLQQTTQIPVFTKTSATVGTARKCNGTGNDVTALMTPTWRTRTAEYAIPIFPYDGNMVAFQDAWTQNLSERMRILHESLEDDNLAFLEANKSASNAGTLNTFNTVDDQMQTALANTDEYIGWIDAEMRQNKFSGAIFNIHTLGKIDALKAKLMAQGAGNQTNQQWQFGRQRFFGSTQMDAPTGASGASYVIEPGTVALLNWVTPGYRKGYQNGDEMWSVFTDPRFPGIEWEMKVTESCADLSSSYGTGYEATPVVSVVISASFANMSAYDSTGTDSGIYKYALMTS